MSSEVSRQGRASCTHGCKASKKKHQQESPTLKSSLWFTHISSNDIEIPEHCLLETHRRASHPQYSSAADTMTSGDSPDGLQPCSGGRIFTADPLGAPQPLLRPPHPTWAARLRLLLLPMLPQWRHVSDFGVSDPFPWRRTTPAPPPEPSSCVWNRLCPTRRSGRPTVRA